ncbi:hypothetical protein ACH5RR_039544 [Cinchona calisaya]|uniref:Uncharacterized protein n=1 Tax=Cinchona calisaya TaxID=153742 RepID=A0ABD2XYK2_9GENT
MQDPCFGLKVPSLGLESMTSPVGLKFLPITNWFLNKCSCSLVDSRGGSLMKFSFQRARIFLSGSSIVIAIFWLDHHTFRTPRVISLLMLLLLDLKCSGILGSWRF